MSGAQSIFSLLLMLVPPVLLVATVPLSIAGCGIRESAAVTAFAYAGLGRARQESHIDRAA